MATIEQLIESAVQVAVDRAQKKIDEKATEIIAKIPTPNYQIVKSSSVTTLTKSNNATYTLTMTTTGKPVYLCCCGDFNPTNTNVWIYVHLCRGDTILTSQVVQADGSSHNQPFALSFIDAPNAGTYTYKAIISLGTTSVEGCTLKDNFATEYPQFMAFEIH